MGAEFATRQRTDKDAEQTNPKSALRVGRADDPAEARADRFADGVVRSMVSRPMIHSPGQPATSLPAIGATRIRRSASHDPLGGTSIDRATADRITSVSGGEQVPEQVRRSAEQVSGRDLSRVRIHRSATAADLSASLQATAFTAGSNIFLGADAARPGTTAGSQLLAHELGHVVEEGGGATVGRIRRRADVPGGTELRRLDSPAAPTVRRLFDSKKKKQAKASKKAAEVEAKVQEQAAQEAERHPSYGALVSAVITVENRLRLLKKDRRMVSTDAPPLLDLANSTRRDLPGSEKDPGFGPLKRRLRIVADETQFLLDEVNVAATKRQAERIYLEDGERGGFKALTNQMKNEEFDDHSDGKFKDAEQESRITARRQAADQLGLSKAEAAAITVFTAQDYRYINPATANSRSWMLANRENPDKKPSSMISSQLDDKFVAERKEEGSLHAGMATQGLMKMPVYQGPTFRGESYNKADFMKKFKIDKKGRVTAKTTSQTRLTISSSTKEREVTEQFVFLSVSDLKLAKRSDAYCLIWEYEVTNGRDIEALSANGHEKEVATLPGATFQVVDISPYPNMGSQFLNGLTNVWLVRARQTK
jgi:hypothetical protein